MPGLLGEIKKKLPFCAPFWVPRFSYFLNKYHTDRHQTWYFMPVGTYNVTKMVELKRERLFKLHTKKTLFLHTKFCTRKNTVFDDFFHKLTKRITSESDTAGKIGPTCCPTIRSTGINPQLVVPVRSKALTILQFLIFSAFFASPKSKRQRAFLDFGERYAHQISGTNVNFSGGYKNATTFWLEFRNR